MLNRILLSLATGLYCTTFFLSNNWYIYPTVQNIFLVVLGTIICSLVILFTAFVIIVASNFISRKFNKKIDLNNWTDLAVVAVSLSLNAILLRNSFVALNLSPEIIIPFIVVFVIFARSKIKNAELKKLSILFLVLTVVSISGLVLGISRANNPILDWTTQNKKDNDQIRFTKKPNVYFIITESYPNKEALGKIYSFDNRPFYENLEERKFTLHHNYFSNYNHTLASLPSLFGMEHHYYSINIGNFDSIGGRSMLESNTYNPVVDIFRQNNYEIQYMFSVDSLLPRGASVDYFSPVAPAYLALETFLSHQDTTKKSIFATRKINFMKTLADRFSKNAANGTPTFSFIYTSRPHHSPSRIKSRNRIEINKILETFRQGYDEKIQKANTHLLEMVDLIHKYDNDPLIIIAGDHGSWGYRIREDGDGKVIPDSLYALDRFGILMAIRFPEDYKRQFDNDFKTHVNLFRYVFAYLSNSNEILENKVQDDSYDYGPQLAISNGKILSKYIPLEFKKKQN